MRSPFGRGMVAALLASALALPAGSQSVLAATTPTPDATWEVPGVRALATDAAGYVYAAVYFPNDTPPPTSKVEKYDQEGTLQATFGEGLFTQIPSGIAVDGAGNIFVVTQFSPPMVTKLDSNGDVVAQWGSFGTGVGQFQGPSDIAVDQAGNVYVAESAGGCRIQKFDNDGNFLTLWGRSATTTAASGLARPGAIIIPCSDAGDILPEGLAIGPNGHVYSTDTLNHRIQEWDSDGNLIFEWETFGTSEDSGLWTPIDIDADALGNLYVVDSAKRQAMTYDADGNRLATWHLDTVPGSNQLPNLEAIASGPLGEVYVADSEHDVIVKYEAAATSRPDARIRRSGGPLRGNDVFNTTGSGQTVELTPRRPNLRRVYVTIQNDGSAPGSFSLAVSGLDAAGYEVRYFRGRSHQELTAEVEAGTFVTPVLAQGQAFALRLRVVTRVDAAPGSLFTRLLTFSSVGDGSVRDAVRLTVRRR